MPKGLSIMGQEPKEGENLGCIGTEIKPEYIECGFH